MNYLFRLFVCRVLGHTWLFNRSWVNWSTPMRDGTAVGYTSEVFKCPICGREMVQMEHPDYPRTFRAERATPL